MLKSESFKCVYLEGFVKSLIEENVCYKMCVPICASARVVSSNIMKV